MAISRGSTTLRFLSMQRVEADVVPDGPDTVSEDRGFDPSSCPGE
jgi:hypothetical protein